MIKRVRDKKQTHVQSENATIHARRRFGHGTKIKALSCLKKLPHGSFLIPKGIQGTMGKED